MIRREKKWDYGSRDAKLTRKRDFLDRAKIFRDLRYSWYHSSLQKEDKFLVVTSEQLWISKDNTSQ